MAICFNIRACPLNVNFINDGVHFCISKKNQLYQHKNINNLKIFAHLIKKLIVHTMFASID